MDIATAKQHHESELMSLPNVVGVALGQDDAGGDAIVVFVTDDSASPATEQVIPRELAGHTVVVRAIGVVQAQGR